MAVALFLILGLMGLYGTAAKRALTECGATPPQTPTERVTASVTYEWSFRPLGFVCIYSTEGVVVDREWVGIWP